MLSVIVPVYNEGAGISENLEGIISYMKGSRMPFEIIVVDDGSTDETASVISKFAKGRRAMRIVTHGHNMGIGAALRTGIRSAKGSLILTVDSDLTYSLSNLPRMLAALEKGADIVIGTPYLRKEDRLEIPFLRYFPSRAGNLFDQLLFGLNFTTPTCFFRLWKASVAKKIPITFDRFEGVPESSIRASKLGYRITEIPAKYNMRRTGRGAVKDIKISIRNTFSHLKMLASLLAFRPKRASQS